MKKILFTLIALVLCAATGLAQKPRPDAFPPVPDTLDPKAVDMAHSIEEMSAWNRYPDYPTYLDMMRHFAATYPDLCRLDTIGTSLQGRLILALHITGSSHEQPHRPEFFYSSSMHGDELTGFILMLRLCDTLLASYGTSDELTSLLNRTHIYINPLANPDGTYHGGDHTVAGAWRYNANRIDLNRNYPDPFGSDPLDTLQQENAAMIDYVQRHHFLLSANLHGGSEVMNYPWDSFTSGEQTNPYSEWWKAVSQRFVDTCRMVDNTRFRDVDYNGYINGGDWYVIHNGRQDYFNYYAHTREITMELSTTKTLPSSRLDHYWQCLSHPLINYIKEIHAIDTSSAGLRPVTPASPVVYPNPTRGPVTVQGAKGTYHFDLGTRPAGVYLLDIEGTTVKVVKL